MKHKATVSRTGHRLEAYEKENGTFFIRHFEFCPQAQEMVCTEVRHGEKEELWNTWISWQEKIELARE